MTAPMASLPARSRPTPRSCSISSGCSNRRSRCSRPTSRSPTAAPATLHLDRQFAPASLVDLAPQSTYTVTLLDRTAGTKSRTADGGDCNEASAFVGKDNAATVKAGHTYALSIKTETSSTVAGTALFGGTTSLRFDNVALSVRTPGSGSGGAGGDGGKGGSGGAGSGPLSDARLLSLLQASSGGTAVLKGNRLFPKRSCPAKIGGACRVSLQGLLKKKSPATTRRVSKVAKGKAKTLVLKVKPKAKAKLAQRKPPALQADGQGGQGEGDRLQTLEDVIRH